MGMDQLQSAFTNRTVAIAPPPFEMKNTLGGVISALTHLPEWAGVLALDELEQRIVFRRGPPFEGGAGRPLCDRDLDGIRYWFEEAHGVVLRKANVVDAVRIVASRSAFHPVRDYLRGLSWDGAPRASRWLEDFAAVVPKSPAHADLVRTMAAKWLIGAVARAMRPGCKVDTMLILEGAQGIGKSRALRALAGERFFCDSAIDFGSKDAFQTIQGVWIYELAELDALLRRETSVVKAFLSRPSDRFRPPYGRMTEHVERSVVFAGTVNHGGYLRDPTGNRRFWVVRCEGPIDVAGLAALRDQLWAEAVQRYRAGESWHLSDADEALLGEEHEERREIDPWEETFAAWVAARDSAATFTMSHILESALGMRAQSGNPRVTVRAHAILTRLGFERRRRGALPRLHHYVRLPVPPSPFLASDFSPHSERSPS
jgi:putative DNA primase/helicase